MEAVAAKAGVGKPTIYREWPNAQSVAMEAFLETTKPQEQERKRGKALDALRDQLHSIIKTFSTPTGRNTAMMIAAAQNDSELAKIFRNRFIMGRREEGRGILRSGMLEGSNVNVVEELVDMIETQRAYEVNSKMIQATDEMMKNATQTL